MPRIVFDDLEHYYNYYGVPRPVQWSERIRLIIFLVYSECVGLPALVWAFRVLHRQKKNKDRTLAFASLLLYNVFIELLLNLFIIPVLLQYNICGQMQAVCSIFTSLWWGSRMCGVLLQQMVLVERILNLRHPFCSAHVFFSRCSTVAFFILMIVVFLYELFTPTPASRLHPLFCLLRLVPVFAVTITSWIITCRKPPIQHHSSNRNENQDYTVLAFSTLTAALYTISIVLYILEIWSLWVMSLCLLSLRVITDAPLCVLICREKHSQAHTDPSTDPAAAQAEQTV